MTMDLEDLGKFHIVIEILVRASIQQVFCIYYGLGVPLNAENSSMNKRDKKHPCPHDAHILVTRKEIQEAISRR